MSILIKKKLKIAILGSGNIGTDLLFKVLRSPFLECALFIGKNLESNGMKVAQSLGVTVSDKSIDAIIDNPDCCDFVFDATSALCHKFHATILQKLGKKVVDLTPAKIGVMCVPAVNLDKCLNFENINMVTCGGQASVPLAYAISQTHSDVEYIEVASTVASKSAGPATRSNLDEYIGTTEKAIQIFSGCTRAKAILNLSPAQPCIDMQTTVFAKIKNPDLMKLKQNIDVMVSKVQAYTPGYELVVSPMLVGDAIMTMVRVKGVGDYLPSYAGNLDIINCAAIIVAEEYAKSRKIKN